MRNPSLQYGAQEAMEVAKHFHGRERWYGKKAVQTATDWADNVLASPYRAISGNNTAGKYSTFMEMIPAAAKATPIEVMMPRVTCAVDQVWVQFWSVTDNATFDFYMGLHEYLV